MDRSSPWVEIVAQPAARVSFQRGKDVKNTHVCIHGEHSSRKKKTCPNIKVCSIFHLYNNICADGCNRSFIVTRKTLVQKGF